MTQYNHLEWISEKGVSTSNAINWIARSFANQYFIEFRSTMSSKCKKLIIGPNSSPLQETNTHGHSNWIQHQQLTMMKLSNFGMDRTKDIVIWIIELIEDVYSRTGKIMAPFFFLNQNNVTAFGESTTNNHWFRCS